MMSFLLCAQLGAFLGAPERLLISADNEDLGRAIVRSANQHVTGSVELLPLSAAAPPRVLHLIVRSDGEERLVLILSRSPRQSVARVVRIAGSHGLFDRAEVVALVIDDLRARLQEQLERASTGPALKPVAPPSPLRPAMPPNLSPPAREEEVAEEAPLNQESAAPLESMAPVVAAPQLHPVPTQLSLTQPPPELSPAPGRRWRIGLGVSLEIAGLAVGGLGVASLALDGRCVDGGVPCDYRFDGRTAGTIEAVFGGAAILTGLGLLASLGYERRTPRRFAWMLPFAGQKSARE